MTRSGAIALVSVLAATLAGCGDDSASKTPTATTAGAAALPALARKPLGPGELVFSGEASPATHEPIALDGRYVVRFEQFAPEDPKKDFSGETAFTARLRPAGSTSSGVELFSTAAASGQTEIRRVGRYALDVTFGDFPYAVRFTPKR